MILGVSSYITSAGLKSVTSAGSLGPYFAIKYFLPIYNFRIDKTICLGYSGSTSAQNISALNLVSATDSTLNAQFEKIYNNVQYNLTDNKNYIYYDSGMTGINDGGISIINGSRQSVSTFVNTLNNSPLSRVVSGTSLSTNTSGTFNVFGTDDVAAISYNPLSGSSSPISAFYRVTSYSPKANGITSASGSYKCKIPAGNGSFKFNGLALYGTKVNENGFDDNGLGVSSFNFKPVLVAIALFDEAQIKQDNVGGINDFEMSVDLGFDWTSYNTSGASPVYIETNYWSKMPISSTTSADGISYDGDVVISSSASPGSWTPRAKLTITDPKKQQLRLNQDDYHFVDVQVKRWGLGDTSATGSRTDLAVLSIDTSCPDDSLLQLGYGTSATAIKSIAMGCNSIAYGYGETAVSAYENVNTQYNGGYTTSIGVDTSAGGFASIAFGQGSLADGYGCFAGGYYSVSTNGNPGVYQPLDSNGFNLAYGYKTSAISKGTSCNSSMYLNDTSTYDMGSNISLGQECLANGTHTIAMGMESSAIGSGAIAIGRLNFSDGCYATTLGNINYSRGYGSVSIGAGNYSDGTPYNSDGAAWAIGTSTSATNTHAIAIGNKSLSSGIGSISIGAYSGSTYNLSSGQYSISFGQSSATGNFSIATGYNNTSSGVTSIAMGASSISTGQGSIAIGSKAYSSSNCSISIGYDTSATNYNSIAIGCITYSSGNCSFAGGYNTSATKDNSFVYGSQSLANGANSTVFGSNNTTNGSGSIIGNNNTTSTTTSASIIFGESNTITGNNSIAIGSNISITTDNTIVIGGILGTGNTTINGYDINIGGSGTDLITLEASNIIMKGWTQTPMLYMYVVYNVSGKNGTTGLTFYADFYKVNPVTNSREIASSCKMDSVSMTQSYTSSNTNVFYVHGKTDLSAQRSIWIDALTGYMYLSYSVENVQTLSQKQTSLWPSYSSLKAAHDSDSSFIMPTRLYLLVEDTFGNYNPQVHLNPSICDCSAEIYKDQDYGFNPILFLSVSTVYSSNTENNIIGGYIPQSLPLSLFAHVRDTGMDDAYIDLWHRLGANEKSPSNFHTFNLQSYDGGITSTHGRDVTARFEWFMINSFGYYIKRGA